MITPTSESDSAALPPDAVGGRAGIHIVDDEIIRERIRRILGEPRRRPWWEQTSRHPLLTLIVGFGLTWGVGTMLTGQFNRQRDARERALEMERVTTEANMRALVELSRLVDQRHARAEMFLGSLRRDAPLDELYERRRLYDEANAGWASNSQASLFVIRDAARDTAYSPIEAEVDISLRRHYAQLDTMLLDAFDRRMSGEPAPDLDAAVIRLRAVDRCGTAFVDELYRDLARRQVRRDDVSVAREVGIGRSPLVADRVTMACKE